MLEVGDTVDRFEVLELLGQGGIARVFKVRHRVLGSLHALKVVTAGGPAVARRLLREGSIQAQLRHPNVVVVSDVIDVRGRSALVLEYVEGSTLEHYLARHGRLDVEPALALFAQVLAAVVAAHRAGVLHRDLKPGNILLAPGVGGVTAKVTDFGLARILLDDEGGGGPRDTLQGRVMGTPGYMAPEQAGDAGGADARADVFALGVVLYELLVGHAPFTRGEIQATLAATLLGDHVPLRDARPDVPEGVADAVERCLSTRRDGRYPDAAALARALFGDRADLVEVVVGGNPGSPLALSMPPRSSEPTGPHPTITAPPSAMTFVPEESEAAPSLSPPPAAPRRAWPWLSGAAPIALLALGLGVWSRTSQPVAAPEAVTEPASLQAPPQAPPQEAPRPPAPVEAAPVVATPTPPDARRPTREPSRPVVTLPAPAVPPEAPPASSPAVPEAEPPAPIAASIPVPQAAPPPEAEPSAGLAGTWTGSWSGRPFTLKLASSGGGQLAGTLEVLVGSAWRTFRVAGTVDATGRFTVAEDTTPGWWVDGALEDGKLAGSLRHPNAKAATGYTATRR